MRPICWATLDKRRPVLVLKLHDQCGWLLEEQEVPLHEAIQAAFDLV